MRTSSKFHEFHNQTKAFNDITEDDVVYTEEVQEIDDDEEDNEFDTESEGESDGE